MKKKTKWILIACASLLVLLTAAIIVTLILNDSYLEKLPYDGVHETVYNNVQIVNDDGQFYLVVSGVRSPNGYSYLKSVNDYYTGTTQKDLATRQLYNYYLAKKSGDANYWLVNSDGSEYRITGENFSLSEVALPYLIFTHNTSARKAAISLRSLQSDLSAHSGNSLALSHTFTELSPYKSDARKEIYDYLFAEDHTAEKKHSVFSSSGARLIQADALAPLLIEKENNDASCYFLDEKNHVLYSAKGELLSQGDSAPFMSPDGTWGYQYSTSPASMSASTDQSVCFFSAEHTFSITNWDYDLSTLRVFGDCLLVDHLHEDAVSVICPLTGEIRPYATAVEKDGFILATPLIGSDWIYIGLGGAELLHSAYDDMKLHAVSTEDCLVFSSPLYNAQTREHHSYFFTTDGKAAVELKLPLEASLSLPDRLCTEETDTPIFLLTQNDQDGTPLHQIYTPFSVNTESAAYHAIDFYCHGGILWALGTSYTKECYDILDPVNNVLTISVAAKTTDLARLSFEHCDTSILLSNAYDQQSGIPLQIIKLNRYEDKVSGIAATRYFAIYRTAVSSSKSFQSATLQVKELGQNLLLDEPYRFFEEENVLAIYSTSGSRIYRFDDTNHLIESASTPYYVCDILSDRADATRCYLKITSLSDRGALLQENIHYGVADSEGTLLLSPSYDDILDAEDNRFVVSLRQAYGVVEARNGKTVTLIDFEYAYIHALADGAYLSARGDDGRFNLYEGDKRIKKNILSFSTVEIANADADGYPVYAEAVLLNINGTLYFHNPKTFEAPRCHSVELPDSHSSALTDRRAKLVSYYDESGALTASDLLLPTMTDQKNFLENHVGEWYTSPKEEEQIAPVTVEDILSSPDYFFRLYPKVSADELE